MPHFIRNTFCLLLLTLTSIALAKVSYSPEQPKTAIEIVNELASKHYSKQALDDGLSNRFLSQYVNNLDPAKSYLLQSDIDEFGRWGNELDNMLKKGDLSAGFYIFNRYQERAQSRLQANIDLLESGFEFDLTKDDSLNMDLEQTQWPVSVQDADAFWKKRIKESYLRLILSDKEPDAARALLVKRYTNLKKQLSQRDSEDIFQIFMNSLAELYDPHTSYMSPRSMENFRIAMSLSLTGIGAVLQREDEHTKVVRIIPGGPADKQGILKAGDKIISVGQDEEETVDVIGWRLDDVVDMIRGAKDTVVKLEIMPAVGEAAGSTREIAIVRDKIQLEEQAAKSEIIDVKNDSGNYRFGVITIPTFYLDVEAFYNRDPEFKSTTKDVQRLLGEMAEQNIDGVILDLRNNGGGFLQEATTLTDLFIDPGPIVQVRDANEVVSRNHRSRYNAYYRGPLMVMTNRLSASASEIFAGAIQDYERGFVVGEQTFGKGTVQIQLPVREGQLKLTESKFYRVSGESTQNLGVVPDIELPAFYDAETVGESSEKNALPWDKINAVPHRRYNLTDLPVDRLIERHKSRLNQDPDLRYLSDELALMKERRAQQSISLNEEQRREEAKNYDLTRLAIENKRRSAKGLSPYETVEAWQAENSVDSDPDAEITKPLPERDPLLYETGNIFADVLIMSNARSMLVQQP